MNITSNVSVVETRQKIVCLEGKKVILRPFDIASDFETFVKWINDPEIVRFMLRVIPAYKHAQLAWFQSLPNGTDVVFTIENFAGNTIGMIGLERINLIDGTAVTWQLIGEKQNRGKGYGTDAKMLLLDYSFNTLRLEKINAEIISNNPASLKYNQKIGFREEGRMKSQIFRDGVRYDLILMGILKGEFNSVLEVYNSKNFLKKE